MFSKNDQRYLDHQEWLKTTMDMANITHYRHQEPDVQRSMQRRRASRFAAILYFNTLPESSANNVARWYEHNCDGVVCDRADNQVLDDDCGVVRVLCCGATREAVRALTRDVIECASTDTDDLDCVRYYSGRDEVLIAVRNKGP